MIHISEAWAIFLSICGGIVTISAAVTVVLKIVKYFKRPNEKQNEEIAGIKKEVAEMKDDFRNLKLEYDEFFRNDKARLDAIEEGNRVTQKALLALLSHGIDGNDVDSMRQAKGELEEYLIKK